MAKTRVEGFELEVVVEDGTARIRIYHSNGDQVLETNKLSIRGMQRMGRVFGAAAKLALPELETYYRRLSMSTDDKERR